MKTSLFFAALLVATLSSCNKQGCTDPYAYNYNESSTKNDGSCEYILGCTDPASTTYNREASKDDGSCSYEGAVLFWTNDPLITFTVTYNGIESKRSIVSSIEAPEDCSDQRHVVLDIPEGIAQFMIKVYPQLGVRLYAFEYDVIANECQTVFID